MTMDFGTYVRKIYDERLENARILVENSPKDFPDSVPEEFLRRLARMWTRDELCSRADELFSIWEDTGGI